MNSYPYGYCEALETLKRAVRPWYQDFPELAELLRKAKELQRAVDSEEIRSHTPDDFNYLYNIKIPGMPED